MVPDTAVVTMRAAAPDETLRFLATVQRAFYADAIDVTDPDVYKDLVAGFPVDRDAFITAIRSPEMHEVAEKDFQEAQWIGVTGFPSLLLRDGATAVPIALGYAPFDQVADRINGIVEKRVPATAESLACDIDDPAC